MGLDDSGDVGSCFSHLGVVVAPDVVRRVVSCPEEHVRLNVCLEELKHVLEDCRWDVAQVASPLGSLSLGISRETVLSSAAQREVALSIRADGVQEVNMYI